MNDEHMVCSKYLGNGLRAVYDTDQERVLVQRVNADNQTIELDKQAAEALLQFMAAVWGDSR